MEEKANQEQGVHLKMELTVMEILILQAKERNQVIKLQRQAKVWSEGPAQE